jgi:1-pyrroline-5-carboxylate dehydrogenase
MNAMKMSALEGYANETYLNFSDPTHNNAQQQALDHVRSEFGKSYKNYIDGRWVEGENGSYESINPSNISEVIGRFPMASSSQAESALVAAEEAFKTWQYTSAKERANYLFKAVEIIQRRRLEINAWMISEAGKNYLEADADTCEAIDFLNYYARLALDMGEGMEVIDSWGDQNKTVYKPMGVGVSISPWNFPFAIFAGMAAAPIVAGNCVVAKPAPDTPKMGQLLTEIFEEVGLPKGVYNYITGDNIEVGEYLARSTKTQFINFTGSLKVGLHLTKIAAEVPEGQSHIKRMVCELGGKNAIVIDKDADIEAAATGIVQAAYGFQGQKCSACSRAIVHADVYDAVLEKVVEKTKALTIGDAKDNCNVTPVVNQAAVDKIMSYIEIGKQEGRLVVGGERAVTDHDGYYIKPTIFADIDRNARIAQEEIFGPVVAFIKVQSLDEAIEIANDTNYGLTGGFFSNNPETLAKVAREFNVGNLYLNRKNTGALVGAQPFGGFKLSGTDGKAGGTDYLKYFTNPKSITLRPLDGVDFDLKKFNFEK